MLPLFWGRSTLTLTMQESATWRLYTGREVMDRDRLWWEVKEAFGQALPHDEAREQWSVRQSEEELERVAERGEWVVEEQGEDEEEEDKEEEEAPDALLHELWRD